MNNSLVDTAPGDFRELHDAKLIAITFHGKKEIGIEFETVSGRRKKLMLSGVVNFFCSGMLEGNIVSSVESTASNEITNDDRAYFVAKEGRGQTVAQLEKAINQQGLRMISIAPSYGAEIGCVCTSVRFDSVS
jgi:hypothetical protein